MLCDAMQCIIHFIHKSSINGRKQSEYSIMFRKIATLHTQTKPYMSGAGREKIVNTTTVGLFVVAGFGLGRVEVRW